MEEANHLEIGFISIIDFVLYFYFFYIIFPLTVLINLTWKRKFQVNNTVEKIYPLFEMEVKYE